MKKDLENAKKAVAKFEGRLVRVKNDGLNNFLFYFIFRLRLKVSMTSYITITNYYII